jgi:hypothetical protein
MTHRVTLDEYQMTFLVPVGLSGSAAGACRRVLNSDRFLRRLRRDIARLVRRFPTLHTVTVRVTR